MDDFGDAPQDRVGDVVAAEDGFEAAVAAVVAEFDAAHVQRGGVRFGVRVDGAADQPGAGGAVDVDAGAGDPLHAVSGEACSGCRAATVRSAAVRCGGGK